MKVIFQLPDNVDDATQAVFVLATPKGIASVGFNIQSKKHQKTEFAVNKIEETEEGGQSLTLLGF